MFNNIIGNDYLKEELIKSVQQNRSSHSYMFIGTSGIGKKLIAKEFGKMLLCLGENKCCNICKSCLEFDNGNQPDFFIIEPDGNKIKIDQIRELQKNIQEKPIISNKKVYIINDADKMTLEAQNCLLKTLEEPPEFVTIILIGENENLFLVTIKSRCTILHFKNIENNQMKKYLEDNFQMNNISDETLELFQGSIGKAIYLKDKQEDYKKVKNMLENLNKKDLIEVLEDAKILYEDKDDIQEILEYINVILMKIAKQNLVYANCIGIVEETKKRLNQNGNYDMCIDNLLFNLWEEVN